MVIRRQCTFKFPSGEPCRMAPLKDSQFCWSHSPEHAQEAQEARKLGGLRRKREATVAVAFDLDGLDTTTGIRRLIEIATTDTLGLDNSIPRNRALGYLAGMAQRNLEIGDMEERISSLEQAVSGRQAGHELPVFDADKRLLNSGDKEKQNDNG